jgi:hypothetical protein
MLSITDYKQNNTLQYEFNQMVTIRYINRYFQFLLMIMKTKLT